MVEVPSKKQDYSKFLPKNLSYDGGTFHARYYPSRRVLKMDPAAAKVNIVPEPLSADGCPSEYLDEDCRERSSSLQSNTSTEYSEDYTRMSESGEEVGARTPPTSVSSDDFSESASLTTIANDDDDDDDEVLLATGAFSAKLAVESDSCKNLASIGKRGHENLKLIMNQDSLELLSPESNIEDDLEYVTLNNIENDIAHSPDDSGGFYEDREFDFLKTERVRRSTSLKTYKTPPGTPRRKKAVRFADALGLDLESVRHILNRDTPPKIPASATRDLRVEPEEERKEPGNKYLSACFTQPSSKPDFLQRVAMNKVALESCLVDDKTMTITGTVRVSNIAFHKHVTVRYSVNRWNTHSDVIASYVQNSNDGPTDRFSFTINVPPYFTMGSRLDFCIMYSAGGNMYWDSNGGNNYPVICYAQAIPDPQGSDSSWMHFL